MSGKRAGKITAALEVKILKLAASGMKGRAIARKLSTRAFSISHVAVGNVIRARRSEVADVAKVTVREELSKKLPADLAVFEKRIGLLVRELRRLETTIRTSRLGTKIRKHALGEYRPLLAEYRRCLDLKLHYVGADTGDGEDQFDGVAGLLGQALES